MKEYNINDNTPAKGLFKQVELVTVAAGGITAGNVTIQSQRGEVRGVSLVVTGGTDAEQMNTKATLSSNGMSFIEKDTLLRYSKEYQRGMFNFIPVEIPESGVLNYSFNNPGATAITVAIELYFYDPTRPSYSKEPQ